MITLEEIKKAYTHNLHRFDKGLFREYLQYQILDIIYDHKVSRKLSFLGETCLRIVHGINRFSEDIDFDNKELSYDEFEELGDYTKRQLELRGYKVEIKLLEKQALHCYVRFPDILYESGISPLKDEKILIQLDTFDQGVNYETENHIINKFDITKRILTTPKSVILAQKLWTITERNRAKGRDFFDTMFLFQTTKPDLTFLESKFKSTNANHIKSIILDHICDFNWDEVAADVAPFLFKESDSEKIKLFPEFLDQVELI